jgi:hypothetical protein
MLQISSSAALRLRQLSTVAGSAGLILAKVLVELAMIRELNFGAAQPGHRDRIEDSPKKSRTLERLRADSADAGFSGTDCGVDLARACLALLSAIACDVTRGSIFALRIAGVSDANINIRA